MSSPWMATKYAILQQNADTASAAQQSQAGLQGAQATNITQMTPGQVALLGNQGRLAGTVADYAPARFQAELDKAAVDEKNANAAGLAAARTAEISADPDSYAGMMLGRNLTPGGVFRFREGLPEPRKPLGMKAGMTRVPGKGDGTKDTVPAKLAPGEAVMNKAAADHMGRGLIAVLNKLGAEKMGMV